MGEAPVSEESVGFSLFGASAAGDAADGAASAFSADAAASSFFGGPDGGDGVAGAGGVEEGGGLEEFDCEGGAEEVGGIPVAASLEPPASLEPSSCACFGGTFASLAGAALAGASLAGAALAGAPRGVGGLLRCSRPSRWERESDRPDAPLGGPPDFLRRGLLSRWSDLVSAFSGLNSGSGGSVNSRRVGASINRIHTCFVGLTSFWHVQIWKVNRTFPQPSQVVSQTLIGTFHQAPPWEYRDGELTAKPPATCYCSSALNIASTACFANCFEPSVVKCTFAGRWISLSRGSAKAY